MLGLDISDVCCVHLWNSYLEWDLSGHDHLDQGDYEKAIVELSWIVSCPAIKSLYPHFDIDVNDHIKDRTPVEIFLGTQCWDDVETLVGVINENHSPRTTPAEQFMSDLLASGRPSYSDPQDVVIESTSVKCRIYGPREILLNSIMVTSYNRERGEGSRVLKIICDLADRHGITIYGNAYPIRRMLSDRILKLPDLIAWYERHGFAVSKEPAVNGVNMIRKPR